MGFGDLKAWGANKPESELVLLKCELTVLQSVISDGSLTAELCECALTLPATKHCSEL